jgi:hypothetical protein
MEILLEQKRAGHWSQKEQECEKEANSYILIWIFEEINELAFFS